MIEVGEYVRTNNGEIMKITKINSSVLVEGVKGDGSIRNFVEEEIKSHSKNAEDLLEVGDLVMMCNIFGFKRLVYISNEPQLVDLVLDIKNGSGVEGILTHELYNKDCYKINLRYENLKTRGEKKEGEDND